MEVGLWAAQPGNQRQGVGGRDQTLQEYGRWRLARRTPLARMVLEEGFSGVLEVVAKSISESVFRPKKALYPLLYVPIVKWVGLSRGTSSVQYSTVP